MPIFLKYTHRTVLYSSFFLPIRRRVIADNRCENESLPLGHVGAALDTSSEQKEDRNKIASRTCAKSNIFGTVLMVSREPFFVGFGRAKV